MVSGHGDLGHSFSDNDIPDNKESVPLNDLESGRTGVDVSSHKDPQDSGRSDDSLDNPEDEVGQGLLGGRSYKHQQGQNSSAQSGWFSSFLRGPNPPRRHRIRPFFESFQTAPIRIIKRLFPTLRSQAIALIAFHALWATIFLTILNWSVLGPEIPGYGMPNRLSCGARLWHNGTLCGIDGNACRPFDEQKFAFRCPAGCHDTILLEPYAVGDQELNYRSLVVGGAADAENTIGSYRGDSFVCAAAIHAGVINNAAGGCGILRRTGEQTSFIGVEKNSITSVSFNSYFPLSFDFEKETIAICRDPRWLLFTVSLIFTSILSLCTTSPVVFYVSVWFISWFQVALASDPPFASDYLEVVSIGMGRLLPASFVGWAIYYFCVRETLSGLTAQWEKTILWLGPFWVGALNTDTFDRIPISRLTPHDIQQQPGAIPALIIIVTILVITIVTQAWAIWSAGKLPRYLVIYGIMACTLIVMIILPQLNLRIHHYILSLLLLPGTALKTRPSLVYQGLLMGLFINGIARWGFDSILQTPNALLGDAQLGSVLPNITAPIIGAGGNNLTFWFSALPSDVSGIAVMINDVLRANLYRAVSRAEGTGTGVKSSPELSFEWTRLHQNHSEYFRFAYMKNSALGGLWYEDFTKAGTWRDNGDWIQ
ncbi:LCCL domain protein [Talaromyces stipitatus ATCC 10500]|uniref:LCCL domain protein n=1 Tax=Talaromyces stipitatus (strain ATCC 10500 / CBS 375.48 / QM 6759 / NRRL 1006) TaxID=441959 RepID=B8MD95_TALSN|nr:LCCL domain protein [Talaromyces stipitatus ATCC 10500]EED17620.1 LCCL domain protein [Talaromyces stipitatus ATCC 10500]